MIDKADKGLDLLLASVIIVFAFGIGVIFGGVMVCFCIGFFVWSLKKQSEVNQLAKKKKRPKRI